jgi:hypothetical protein
MKSRVRAVIFTFPLTHPPLIETSPAIDTTDWSAKIPVNRQPTYNKLVCVLDAILYKVK